MGDELYRRDFLAISDLSRPELLGLLEVASQLKGGLDPGTPLARDSIAMVFLRPSNRTRVSFEAAVHRLGGHPISLFDREIEMGRRESVADVGRILDRFVVGLVARIPSDRDLRGLAQAMQAPVINAMTDRGHPCQVLADCLTVREALGHLEGARVAFVGDGNNVCASLMEAAEVVGLDLRVVAPPGYEPAYPISQLETAVSDAEIIYTDVWTSMGQEEQHEDRRQDFGPYQVNQALLSKAPRSVKVMHCLPAHRGEEITDEVLDGPQSIVFAQAENRYWVQLALLLEIFSVRAPSA
ncbi:MAG: ornithine carbamoyltransferase [Candidatus Dormibacteria bacterium]